MTKTDKTPTALPKVGEVWVEMHRKSPMAVITVLAVERALDGLVRVQWCKLGDEPAARYWTRAEFRAFTKRAVRVDDKERGR